MWIGCGLLSGQLTVISQICASWKRSGRSGPKVVLLQLATGFFNATSLAFSGASGYSEVKSSPGETTEVVWEWCLQRIGGEKTMKQTSVSEENMQNQWKCQ